METEFWNIYVSNPGLTEHYASTVIGERDSTSPRNARHGLSKAYIASPRSSSSGCHLRVIRLNTRRPTQCCRL